ncbi:MAG: hypothetical protein WCT18_03215 [Patescibacteria group bacterium]
MSLQQRLEKKLKQETALLQMRLALIESVNGVKYEPKSKCPRCGKELTHLEIMNGFLQDVNDFTTECPKCKTRMRAYLHAKKGSSGMIEIAMYCPMQTIERLRGKDNLTEEEIEKENLGVYSSAIVNFGSLKNAFATFGVNYLKSTPKVSWQEKVRDFLGYISDVEISKIVGVHRNAIGAYRRSLGIDRATKEDLLEWGLTYFE